MPRRDRDVTRATSRATFVRTLRRLADALERDARVRVAVRGERVEVPGDAACSIEHERSGGEHELELQLRWRRA